MDLTRSYGMDEAEFLLGRYIPEIVRAQDSVKLRSAILYGRADENLDDEARTLAEKLSCDTEADRLLVKLSIRSPTGRRDATGALGLHAVALCINHVSREIHHQDPYGLPMDAQLQAHLADILFDFRRHDHRVPQQKDSSSCLPITIRNLVAFAKDQAPDPAIDVVSIRTQDAKILRDFKKPQYSASGGPRNFVIKSAPQV